MINSLHFYGLTAAQQVFQSDSDFESDISAEESSSYCPSHSLSSEMSKSDEAILDDSNSDNDDDRDNSPDDRPLHGAWHAVDGTHRKQFVFVDDGGIYGFSGIAQDEITPIDVYSKMETNDIYDLIVEQTNLDAQQVLTSRHISRKPQLSGWRDKDTHEVKKALAIVLYMGVVKHPSIETYWCRDPFYKNSFVPQIMSHNRFRLILRFLYFADNESPRDDEDRLYKARK